MAARVPMTLITGPLGSGKTTLLRHVLDSVDAKIAILMNEFGEMAIDSRIIQGKNIQIAELGGGCVCCSLQGEFEAAVEEILKDVQPDLIVVETTGLAEPEALIFDVQESLPDIRLDGVITVVDADSLVRYPQIGHTSRMQIEDADLILLNKVDLVDPAQTDDVENKLRQINELAEIIRTVKARVDPELLFGIGRERTASPAAHVHQPEFASFSFVSDAEYSRERLDDWAASLSNWGVYRSKGFVHVEDGSFLFNFVAGRWEFESFPADKTSLVFIGKNVLEHQEEILAGLEQCKA
ncbi:MAG TPA: GTP-binding protein [Acidobacteriota bacterium]|nr:GTP-binding protein [Acidobacteriota bacterium]